MPFLKPLSKNMNQGEMREIHYADSYPGFKASTLKCRVAYIYFMVTHFHCVMVCNVNNGSFFVSCESVQINMDFFMYQRQTGGWAHHQIQREQRNFDSRSLIATWFTAHS